MNRKVRNGGERQVRRDGRMAGRDSGTAGHVFDPAIHQRRSIRLQGFDYTRQGSYFITMRAAPGVKFGVVVNRRMAFNNAGRAVAACWLAIPEHFPHCALDEWIAMPDHFHGILRIEKKPSRTGTACRAPSAPCHAPVEAFGQPVSGSIPTIIRSFKSAATQHTRKILAAPDQKIWQRNYYEIIIRNNRALSNIRAYIRNNPAHWDVLRYGEAHYSLGNRALLDLPLTAFLASRGEDRARRWARHAVPVRGADRPEAVVSGFLSPMERAVFDACLDDEIPMIHVLARGLPDRMPRRVSQAVDVGRLLIMTPFDTAITYVNAARAAWCNQYVLHLASRVIVGHLVPDGMLACLLAELTDEKPIAFSPRDDRRAPEKHQGPAFL